MRKKAKQNVGANTGAGLHKKPSPFFNPLIVQDNDKLEMEADQMANQVLQMKPIKTSEPISTTNIIQRKCVDCEEEGPLQKKSLSERVAPLVQRKTESTDEGTVASDAVNTKINQSEGGGQPIAKNTRGFMESGFGSDFSNVRIHTDSNAKQLSNELQAHAFTVGNDIYFNEGKYQPNSHSGKHLLAHELTHTIQQESVSNKSVQRLSKEDCSKDCVVKDGTIGKTGKFRLIVYADKESDFIAIPFKKDSDGKTWPVGHSWIKLIDDAGNYWTYGFWPESGFSGSSLFKDVEGCVHHPDISHKATAKQEFELTKAEFDSAKKEAVKICNENPKYNLYDNQCTSFVQNIMNAAGQAPIGGFGFIWETPNALSSWMDGSRKTLGFSYDLKNQLFDNQSEGLSLQASYVHQFYTLLGNKLRLQWLNLGSIAFSDGAPSYLSSGLQLEYKPQGIVYIPDFYLNTNLTGGRISPQNVDQTLGLGISSAIGVNYNVQNSLMVGFEYNVIKNLTQNDPLLHSLSLKIGLVFQ